ncbi:hypothetical protein [Agromyces sp. ZXT2-3]|uniref:hypothetical protein n=1 Tax=Agromyces sp. ZXT2-3 TaxID=3461152 RepID=UPI004055269B
MSAETRAEKFRRLASARGDRVLKDLELIGNLANRSNYEYTDDEVRKLFSAIEAEVRDTKAKFTTGSGRRRIKF